MKLRTLLWTCILAPTAAMAQVPDLVCAFDAGGRAMGMGGATSVTGSDSTSTYYNPAGLGLLNQASLSATLRNFPETKTTVTGDIGPAGTQFLSTSSEGGARALGHAGIVFPLKGRNGATNGTVGLSLTQGGQLHDFRTAGAGLTDGGLPAGGYSQFIKAANSFVNLSYGRSTSDGSFSWGAGLVYASSRQVNNRNAPSGNTLFDQLATGIGGQVGILVSPKDNPDLSLGLSYRTPIKLHTGGATPLILPEIPGRLSGGIALRRDGFRKGGRDWMILGADVQHYFSGQASSVIDRDQQTMFGLGLEYSYGMGSNRIPIRLGYSTATKGGAQFDQRNVLTFGLGFRPSSGDWAIDFNFGRSSSGSADSSISLSYKIGK